MTRLSMLPLNFYRISHPRFIAALAIRMKGRRHLGQEIRQLTQRPLNRLIHRVRLFALCYVPKAITETLHMVT